MGEQNQENFSADNIKLALQEGRILAVFGEMETKLKNDFPFLGNTFDGYIDLNNPKNIIEKMAYRLYQEIQENKWNFLMFNLIEIQVYLTELNENQINALHNLSKQIANEYITIKDKLVLSSSLINIANEIKNTTNNPNQQTMLIRDFYNNASEKEKTGLINYIEYFFPFIKNNHQAILIFIENNLNIINEKNIDYKHIAIITNIFTINPSIAQNIEETATSWLKNKKTNIILRQKSVLILIALGAKVNQFTREEMMFIGETLIDTHRSLEHKIKDIIADDYYLNIGKNYNFSLARYISSIISTVQQKNDPNKRKSIFLNIVETQEEIKNLPILPEGVFLPLIHSVERNGNSFFDATKDAFYWEPFLQLALQSGQKLANNVKRYRENGTSTSDFLNIIENSQGPPYSTNCRTWRERSNIFWKPRRSINNGSIEYYS